MTSQQAWQWVPVPEGGCEHWQRIDQDMGVPGIAMYAENHQHTAILWLQARHGRSQGPAKHVNVPLKPIKFIICFFWPVSVFLY